MNPGTHRYQRWPGRHRQPSPLAGLWAIVLTGVRLQYNRRFVRPLLLAGPAIVVGVCVMLYLLSLLESLAGQPQAQGLYEFARVFLGVDLSAVSRISELRDVIWQTVFAFAIRIELYAVMILMARIGPGLIADDIKVRALPIYFAHPINPKIYLLGKWIVAATFIGLVTLAPNLLSLIFGSAITGGLSDIGTTLILGLNIVIAGLGIMLCGGLVMVALSSITSDSRYVTVGWLSVCLLPAMAQGIVDSHIPPAQMTGWLGSISFNNNVAVLTERLFDLRAAWQASGIPSDAFAQALASPVQPLYPALVLGGVTLMAGTYCYRRISTFSRSAAGT